mgnify:CR=1 FL=1
MAEEVKSRIEKLRSKVYGIRTVKAGDYVDSRDHNLIVECMRELADILAVIPIEKVVEKVEVKVFKFLFEAFTKTPVTPPPIPPTLDVKFYGEFMWGAG